MIKKIIAIIAFGAFATARTSKTNRMVVGNRLGNFHRHHNLRQHERQRRKQHKITAEREKTIRQKLCNPVICGKCVSVLYTAEGNMAMSCRALFTVRNCCSQKLLQTGF